MFSCRAVKPILFASSDFPLPALLKDNLPEVTGMTRFWPRPKTVTIGNRAFAQDIAEVDTNFFQLIRFPLVAGDPATVLSRPDAIVLSQSLARKSSVMPIRSARRLPSTSRTAPPPRRFPAPMMQ